MTIVDDAFAALPRSLWCGGPLWRAPDDTEVARWLAHAGTPDPAPAPRVRGSQGASPATRAATAARRARVADLRDAGLSAPQIAANLGASVYAIEYDLRELRRAEGLTGVGAAINAAHAARRAAIYAMLDAGCSHREITDATGASHAAICRAVAARKGKESRA